MMQNTKLLAVILTALTVGVVFGYQKGDARTFYVAASGGSDDNDGTSRDAPFATFAHGVQSLKRNGDKLVVLKGHHYLDGTVPKYVYDTTTPPNTEIVGDSDDRTETTIDGLGKYRALCWMINNNSSGHRIANLTFQNLGNGQDFTDDSEGGTPFRTLANNCIISNCIFRNICVTNQYMTSNQAWTPLYIGGSNNTIVDCDFIALTNTSSSCSGGYSSEGALHTFIRCKFKNCYVSGGGAVSLRYSSYQRGNFTDCLFQGNHSPNAGACVQLYQGSPACGIPSVFTRCDFVDNVSTNSIPTVYAGSGADAAFYHCGFSNNIAVATQDDNSNYQYNKGCVNVQSTNGFHYCTFSNNYTYSRYQSAAAVIVITSGTYITNLISHCIFRDNHAMKATGGTALSIEGGGVRVEDSIFEDNVAHRSAEGGGGAVKAGSCPNNAAKVFVQFDRCVFRRNSTAANGSARGGAMNLYDSAISTYVPSWVRNCVFEGNYGGVGSGIACFFFNDISIENCTFITNKCYSNGGGTVYGRNFGSAQTALEAKWCVSNCLFYGNLTGTQNTSKGIALGTWYADSDKSERLRAAAKCGNNYLETAQNKTFFPDGERNNTFSDADPFTSLTGGDLTVTKQSGARDTAVLRPWMTKDTLDVWGNKRLSGKATAANALPDIGAVEYQYRYGAMIIFR